MAKLILKSDFDVFAAIEVMRVEAADDLLTELRRLSGQPWELIISEEPAGEYSYREYFAFYYRKDRLSAVEDPKQFCSSDHAHLTVGYACYAADLRTADGAPDFEREPFVGHFEMHGQLITIAAVHIYYGDRSADAVGRRRHEMKGLLRVVDQIEANSPKDNIFVVGDFNLEIEDDKRGLDDSIPSWFLDADMVGVIYEETTVGGSNYDHIFYRQGNSVQWEANSAEVILDFVAHDPDARTQYKEDVSDHFPVKAKFGWKSH